MSQKQRSRRAFINQSTLLAPLLMGTVRRSAAGGSGKPPGFQLYTLRNVLGVDPVELLARYSGRVALIHIKDKARGTEQGFVEQKVPASAFKEIGNGVLDMAGILRQAAKSGVKHYLVEQDQCPGDPVASLELSFRNLRKIPV